MMVICNINERLLGGILVQGPQRQEKWPSPAYFGWPLCSSHCNLCVREQNTCDKTSMPTINARCSMSVSRDRNSSTSPRDSVGSHNVSRLSRIKRLGGLLVNHWTTGRVRSLPSLSPRWVPMSAASSNLFAAESQATKNRCCPYLTAISS